MKSRGRAMEETMEHRTWVGVDVSKESLDVFVNPISERRHHANHGKGIAQILKQIKTMDSPLVVVEATGGYERAFFESLQEQGIAVVLVNPRQVRDFAKAAGILAKTDRLDAEVLALFAKTMNPVVRAASSEQEQELKELMTRRRQITDVLIQEKNRLEHSSGFVRQQIQKHIKNLEEALKELDQRSSDLIQNTHALQDKEALLRSVPGIGPFVARTLLSQLPELGQINRRALAALVGIAPFNVDSGSFRGKRRVWGGREPVRSALYMSVVSALRYNPVIRSFYDHLRSLGKPAKVAIVACMRKLVTILNCMVKNKTPWKYVTA